MDIRTRLEFGWPKVPGKSSRYPVPRANTNLGMSAHYDGANKNLADRSHDSCVSYWLSCRRMHMSGNGWSDIGYAYGVCAHGYIFEGRGFGYMQAAQAQQGNRLPDGNSRWVTVTFMSGPSEDPTDAQLAAWHRLRNWLMSTKGVGARVKGHRDFSLTDCPGDKIYKLVQNGTLANAPKDLGDDEDMALPLLKEDAKGSFDVKTLRGCLYARGFVPSTVVTDSALRGWLDNTVFDAELKNIVMGFQRAKDLTPDGIVGPKTWAKLLRQ